MSHRQRLLRLVLFLSCLTAATPAEAGRTIVIINNGNGLPQIYPGIPPLYDQTQRFIGSTPDDNETIDRDNLPDAITLNFTYPVRASRSYIKIYDGYGQLKSDGKVRAEGGVLSTAMPDLPPGMYRVKWQALCVCDDNISHALSDVFRFNVR